MLQFHVSVYYVLLQGHFQTCLLCKGLYGVFSINLGNINLNVFFVCFRLRLFVIFTHIFDISVRVLLKLKVSNA